MEDYSIWQSFKDLSLKWKAFLFLIILFCQFAWIFTFFNFTNIIRENKELKERNQQLEDEIGYFTLIDEKLEIRFGKLASNQTIIVYALDLGLAHVYLINISENQENLSLAWQACAFTDVDSYSINHKLSLDFMNCTSLSVQLWTNPNWDLDCLGITGYSPSKDVLLDEIIIKV